MWVHLSPYSLPVPSQILPERQTGSLLPPVGKKLLSEPVLPAHLLRPPRGPCFLAREARTLRGRALWSTARPQDSCTPSPFTASSGDQTQAAEELDLVCAQAALGKNAILPRGLRKKSPSTAPVAFCCKLSKIANRIRARRTWITLLLHLQGSQNPLPT